MDEKAKTPSPLAVVIASILVPGLGYWLIGHRKRALIVGGGIVLLYLSGIFIAGVRVVSVPGYDDGYPVYYEYTPTANPGYYTARPTTQPVIAVESVPGAVSPLYRVTRRGPNGTTLQEQTSAVPRTELAILKNPMGLIGDNLWFIGQALAPTLTVVTGYIANELARNGVERSYFRLADIGSLYTVVAGMLNLMVIVDGYGRAQRAGKGRRS